MHSRSLPPWVLCVVIDYIFMAVVLINSESFDPQPFAGHIIGFCALGTICLFWRDTLELSAAVIHWPPVLWSLLLGLGAYNKDALFGLVSSFLNKSLWTQIFYCLAAFKFVKIVVHLISYNLYRAAAVPARPTILPRDVSVIIPSVGNFDDEFVECIRSIIVCHPREVIISTIGQEKLKTLQQVIQDIGDDRVRAIRYAGAPSKRQQVMAAVDIQHPDTKVTVLADDHVFWPASFLRSALTPFEDPLVGHVGTAKRVRRVYTGRFIEDLLNYIACIYLERHNFECTASHAVDGGVFVISGRTALIRTNIIWDPKFKHGFLNETWCGKGPLNVDDDNFITRWMVKYGYKVVFHNTKDALMETSLGIEGITKFRGQLLRWARTTWRSNSTSLFVDKTIWYSQPWSVYAVYFSAFVNFALFYDIALCYTYLQKSKSEIDFSIMATNYYDILTEKMLPFIGLNIQISPLSVPYLRVMMLAIVLFATKLIKVWSHLWRNPCDWFYLPFGIIFGYCHSLLKLHALITCQNINWGTRSGVDNQVSQGATSNQDPATTSPAVTDSRVNQNVIHPPVIRVPCSITATPRAVLYYDTEDRPLPVRTPQGPLKPPCQSDPAGLHPPSSTPQGRNTGLSAQLWDPNSKSSPAKPKLPRSSGTQAAIQPLWKSSPAAQGKKAGRPASPRVTR